MPIQALFLLKELKAGGKIEGAALAQGAFRPHFALHQADQFLGKGQAQADTAVLTGGRLIHLGKELKDLLQGILGDAGPGVADGKEQADFVGRGALLLGEGDLQGYLALAGKFNGVIQQVQQYLLEAALVPTDDFRQGLVQGAVD